MGYSLSWVAFRGRGPDEVLTELQLEKTGVPGSGPDTPFALAHLDGGWTLLLNDGDFRFADEGLLARLSVGAEAMACSVIEGQAASEASGWKDGNCLWSLSSHDEDGEPTLETTGEPPPAWAGILQTEGPGDGPVELCRALVGFRHDDASEPDYLALRDLRPPPPKKTFWARLRGR